MPNITYNYNSITVKGFWGFNFHNSNNEPIDITGFDFENYDLSDCNFTGIALDNCNFKNATIQNTNFSNVTMNNTSFEYINGGNNNWGTEKDRKVFNKLHNVGGNSYFKSYVLGPGVNLENVDFSDQNIENISFKNSNLENAILPTINFNNANL